MRSLKFALLFSIALSAGCSSSPEYSTGSEYLPNIFDRRMGQVALKDEAIEIRAREELNKDPEIPSRSHININVYNGTLLITGEAPEEQIHAKIIAGIRIIKGVKRVLDEIEIAPETDQASHYNDSSITNRIKTELDKIHNPVGFTSQNIKVFTENGNVYLMGLVYKEEADIVTKVTQEVPGVKNVIKLFEYLRQE